MKGDQEVDTEVASKDAESSPNVGDLFDAIPVAGALWMLSDDQRVRLAQTALNQRTSSAGQRLRSALRFVRVDGFRNPAKAPAKRLAGPVLDEMRRDDKLASLLLLAWEAALPELRAKAAERLAKSDINGRDEGGALKWGASWPISDCMEHGKAIAEDESDVEKEEAAFMCCLVSGRFPMPEVSPPASLLADTALIQGWLSHLESMPLDADEWEDLPVLLEGAMDLLLDRDVQLAKQEQADVAEGIKGLAGFESELRYLEIDTAKWGDEIKDRFDLMEDATCLLDEMHQALARYRAVRPQADSRSEEARRVEERTTQEERILGLEGQWRKLLARPKPELPEEEEDEEQPAPAADASRKELKELESLRAEFLELKESHEESKQRYHAEAQRLEEANATLRQAKAQRDDEISELKGEVTRLREAEDYWRASFFAAKRSSPEDGTEVELRTVQDAVDLASEQFGDELLISLNSKSSTRSPFQRPQEVFDALAWLATAYRRDPEASIGDACPGWFFRRKQSDSTMGMFREWYETRVAGNRYDLTSHVGKGSSFDPKTTIRIGFAWDGENDRVIVGFIGQHQKSRQS